MKKLSWSGTDLDFLKENYYKFSSKEIGEILGKTKKAVYTKVWELSKENLEFAESINKNKNSFLTNGFYKIYSRSAKRRKLEFSIDFDTFSNLISSPCYYCGGSGTTYIRQPGLGYHNGLDRINNNIGYTNENCVPCCKLCNFMKMKLHDGEFLDQIEKIYVYQHRFND